MRRTVKAWGRIHSCDPDRRGPLCPSSIRWERMGLSECAAGLDIEPGWVRLTISYDDGRPAPRKRTKGKKGGRRG